MYELTKATTTLILPDSVPRCREIRDDFLSPDQLPQKVGFLSWFSGGLLIHGSPLIPPDLVPGILNDSISPDQVPQRGGFREHD
jgi:hypothetical protein